MPVLHRTVESAGDNLVKVAGKRTKVPSKRTKVAAKQAKVDGNQKKVLGNQTKVVTERAKVVPERRKVACDPSFLPRPRATPRREDRTLASMLAYKVGPIDMRDDDFSSRDGEFRNEPGLHL
jgi:hypothetical protein